MTETQKESTGGTDESQAKVPPPSDEEPASSEPPTTLGLINRGWTQLRAQPVLLAPFLLATGFVVAAQLGISTRQTRIGRVPEFEHWVWFLYLAAFLVTWIGLGAVFVAAGFRSRSSDRPYVRQVTIAVRRLPTMIVAGIIGGIPIAAGLFAFAVPGVYLLLKMSLTFQGVVIDNATAVQALRRSWVFTDGRLSTILGLYITFAAVMVGLSTVVTVAFKVPGTQPGLIGPLVHNLATAVIIPTFGLAFGHLYLDSQ